MTEIEKLAMLICDLHGTTAKHIESERVHETFEGETVWDGTVEVFALNKHPKAALAYAWSYETDEGTRRYMAVLGAPPINTAMDAVRAVVIAETKAPMKR